MSFTDALPAPHLDDPQETIAILVDHVSNLTNALNRVSHFSQNLHSDYIKHIDVEKRLVKVLTGTRAARQREHEGWERIHNTLAAERNGTCRRCDPTDQSTRAIEDERQSGIKAMERLQKEMQETIRSLQHELDTEKAWRQQEREVHLAGQAEHRRCLAQLQQEYEGRIDADAAENRNELQQSALLWKQAQEGHISQRFADEHNQLKSEIETGQRKLVEEQEKLALVVQQHDEQNGELQTRVKHLQDRLDRTTAERDTLQQKYNSGVVHVRGQIELLAAKADRLDPASLSRILLEQLAAAQGVFQQHSAESKPDSIVRLQEAHAAAQHQTTTELETERRERASERADSERTCLQLQRKIQILEARGMGPAPLPVSSPDVDLPGQQIHKRLPLGVSRPDKPRSTERQSAATPALQASSTLRRQRSPVTQSTTPRINVRRPAPTTLDSNSSSSDRDDEPRSRFSQRTTKVAKRFQGHSPSSPSPSPSSPRPSQPPRLRHASTESEKLSRDLSGRLRMMTPLAEEIRSQDRNRAQLGSLSSIGSLTQSELAAAGAVVGGTMGGVPETQSEAESRRIVKQRNNRETAGAAENGGHDS